MEKNKVVAKFISTVEQIGSDFMKFPWDQELAYAGWLAQTYYFVRHTTTLVSLSAAKFGARDRDSHYEMLAHLADERGHDLLALEDLKSLGYQPEVFPEYPETSVFYQNQYYMIQHESPQSHLGYSLCLEGLAARYCPEVYTKIAKHYGKSCCEFVRVHATVDQDHFDSGLQKLDSLTSEQAGPALKNLEQSVLLYRAILNRIVSDVAKTKKPRKSA